MESISTNAAQSSSTAFFALINNSLKFRLFLLKNLPSVYFSGVKLTEVTIDRCVVSVPYKWFTKNPFRCTYFACLSMAAEMSTGILSMANTYKRSPKISMLVTGIEGKFYKKAKGVTRFVCEEGASIKQTIETAIHTNEPQSIRVLSSGFNKKNEPVCEFWVAWSFKVKQ